MNDDTPNMSATLLHVLWVLIIFLHLVLWKNVRLRQFVILVQIETKSAAKFVILTQIAIKLRENVILHFMTQCVMACIKL